MWFRWLQESVAGAQLHVLSTACRLRAQRGIHPEKGAPGGTESCSEVRGHLEKHLVKDEVVACSDAGAGLNAAWKRLNIPEATLSKAAGRKRPAAVWTPAKAVCKGSRR